MNLSDLFNSLSGGSTIGLDIGHSGIKVSLVTGSNSKFSLKYFNYVPFEDGAIVDEEFNHREEIVSKIRNELKASGLKGKGVVIGLSGSNCVIRKMEAPEGTDADINDHIDWEAEQFIPFGIDNAEISNHIMEKRGSETRDVVMTAAKTDYIEEYERLVKDAGGNVKIVDMQCISLINLFEASYSADIGEYRKGTLIIDFGSQSTKVIMYKQGMPLMVKSLEMGGHQLTENIQREVGLGFDEAESLKVLEGGIDHFPEEVEPLVENHITSLSSKIKDSITFFNSNTSTDRIYFCILTGGSVLLPGLLEELAESIDAPVEILNPFRNGGINITNGSVPKHLIESLPYLSPVSLGLSLRGAI